MGLKYSRDKFMFCRGGRFALILVFVGVLILATGCGNRLSELNDSNSEVTSLYGYDVRRPSQYGSEEKKYIGGGEGFSYHSDNGKRSLIIGNMNSWGYTANAYGEYIKSYISDEYKVAKEDIQKEKDVIDNKEVCILKWTYFRGEKKYCGESILAVNDIIALMITETGPLKDKIIINDELNLIFRESSFTGVTYEYPYTISNNYFSVSIDEGYTCRNSFSSNENSNENVENEGEYLDFFATDCIEILPVNIDEYYKGIFEFIVARTPKQVTSAKDYALEIKAKRDGTFEEVSLNDVWPEISSELANLKGYKIVYDFNTVIYDTYYFEYKNNVYEITICYDCNSTEWRDKLYDVMYGLKFVEK